MIWQTILLIIIFLLIIPIPIKFTALFKILRLSGEIEFRVLKIFKFGLRVKFRGSYVYITNHKGTRREKLTNKNYNIAYLIQLIRQIYFRTELNQITIESNIGYYNDALYTAIGSSAFDIVSKCLLARILHNKKSAHIFVKNNTKYNQDCLNIKTNVEFKISMFDIIYSLVNAKLSLRGEEYERDKTNYEQNQGLD